MNDETVGQLADGFNGDMGHAHMLTLAINSLYQQSDRSQLRPMSRETLQDLVKEVRTLASTASEYLKLMNQSSFHAIDKKTTTVVHEMVDVAIKASDDATYLINNGVTDENGLLHIPKVYVFKQNSDY